ncbi:MAG: hypothetical protein ACTSRA_01100 [Promethearchaeota archaeon]
MQTGKTDKNATKLPKCTWFRNFTNSANLYNRMQLYRLPGQERRMRHASS